MDGGKLKGKVKMGGGGGATPLLSKVYLATIVINGHSVKFAICQGRGGGRVIL